MDSKSAVYKKLAKLSTNKNSNWNQFAEVIIEEGELSLIEPWIQKCLQTGDQKSREAAKRLLQNMNTCTEMSEGDSQPMNDTLMAELIGGLETFSLTLTLKQWLQLLKQPKRSAVIENQSLSATTSKKFRASTPIVDIAEESDQSVESVPFTQQGTHMSTMNARTAVPHAGAPSTKDISDSEDEDLFTLCKKPQATTGKISSSIYAFRDGSSYSAKGEVEPSSNSQVIEFKIYQDLRAYMSSTAQDRWRTATYRGTVVTSTKQMKKAMKDKNKLMVYSEPGKIPFEVTPLEFVANSLPYHATKSIKFWDDVKMETSKFKKQ